MSKRAKDRANDVAAMPHVRAWVRRLRKLAADMPPEVEVFVAVGTPVVLALEESGKSFAMSDGRLGERSDQSASIAAVYGGRWDGGDF